MAWEEYDDCPRIDNEDKDSHEDGISSEYGTAQGEAPS